MLGRAQRVARNINFFTIYALLADFIIQMKFYVLSELFRGVFVTLGRLATELCEVGQLKAVNSWKAHEWEQSQGDLTNRHLLQQFPNFVFVIIEATETATGKEKSSTLAMLG